MLQFDLSKAFGTLDVNCIISFNLGIRGNILEWINSYLTDRKIMVRIGTHFSEQFHASRGVPQGSVLGPLLFILYVYDLPNHITNGSVKMFADNSTIIVSGLNVNMLNKKLNDVLDEFSAWCDRNKLILNSTKTTHVNFYNRRPCLLQNFKFCNKSKFLGVVLDADLYRKSQIDIVCKELNRAYIAFLHMKNIFDQKSLINMCYSLTYSHISLATDRDRVFICQNKLIRLIFNLKPGETCKESFKSNKLLTTPSIYIYKCFVKKNLHFFDKISSHHNHATRSSDLLIPAHTSALYEKSPTYYCVKLYSLPLELKNNNKFNSYKHQVKVMLIDGAFYSTDAFFNSDAGQFSHVSDILTGEAPANYLQPLPTSRRVSGCRFQNRVP